MTENEKLFYTFDEMKLSEGLLRGIYGHGYERPSVIQQRAIVPAITGRDVIAQAQSGTGKTCAFTVATLQQIDFDTEHPVCQAIVLSPTKELAEQTLKVFNSLGTYLGRNGSDGKPLGVNAHLCIGGKNGGRSVKDNLDALRKGIHVMIGTPGRVYDLLNRGAIDPSKIKTLVIDEADVMLDRGFKEQLYWILSSGLPADMQICLFSATLSDETLEITNKFMKKDPIEILIKKSDVVLDGIKQLYINVEKEEDKLSTLEDIFELLSISQCILYCNSKSKVEWLRKQLRDKDFPVEMIHGDMAEEREEIMARFRANSFKLLITTDLLARGIDIQGVSLVINYDLPTNRENYIHRIGRTGRYGRKGVALNLITKTDKKYRDDIESYYQTEMVEMKSPNELRS
jgi:translation initiation factor 4A